jgi:hypothetical protein
MAIERDVLADGIPSQSVIEDLDELVQEAVGDNYYTKDETEELIDNELKDVYPLGEASGAIASFNTGVIMPLKSLTAEIKATETGSGEKSPSNPYTINGFDNGVVSVCGKNFLNANGTYTDTQSKTWIDISCVIPSGTYTFSRTINSTSGAITLKFTDANGNTILDESMSNVSASKTITLTKTAYGFSSYSNSLVTISNIMLEKGNQATTYEAYNGNTYTFTFGQTVYGGYFDNKGNLVVTKAIINLGSLDWTYHAPSGNVGAFFDAFLPSNSIIGNRDIAFDGNIGIYNIIPSKDIALSGYDNNICALANATRRFITCDQRFTDANSYKNAMNGVMLGYPLANPITLSITSQDIPTLLNENNIFTNTNGNVDVIYHHALTAKNIYFDNTGTALQADNVEDAIKEILTLIQGDNNSRALNLSKGSLKVEAPVSNEETATEECPTTEEDPEAISDSESEPISDEER